VDPLLEARLDMSLDDILGRPYGGGRGGGRGGRGRRFAARTASKPYDRAPSISIRPSPGPPPVSTF
jgi:hypothetical protein